MTVSTLFVIQFFFFFVLSNKVYLNPLQTLQSTNIAMFAGPIQSHRNFSNYLSMFESQGGKDGRGG